MQNEKAEVTIHLRSKGPQKEEEEAQPLPRSAKRTKALPGISTAAKKGTD